MRAAARFSAARIHHHSQAVSADKLPSMETPGRLITSHCQPSLDINIPCYTCALQEVSARPADARAQPHPQSRMSIGIYNSPLLAAISTSPTLECASTLWCKSSISVFTRMTEWIEARVRQNSASRSKVCRFMTRRKVS
jgi:hypothetical protein